MSPSVYSSSQAFFEISSGLELMQFNTLKERWACLKDFLKKAAILPFALAVKAFKTFFRAAGMLAAALFLVATLGVSSSGRELFIERVSFLAKDLADWVLFPLAIGVWIFRFLLAVTVHPAFYFKN